MKILFLFIITLTLAGCGANPINEKAYALYKAGRYQEAANTAAQIAAYDEYACYLQASLYYDDLGRQKEGLSLMNLCAQRGGKEAQNWLAQKSFTVPDTIRPSDRAVDVNIRSK